MMSQRKGTGAEKVEEAGRVAGKKRGERRRLAGRGWGAGNTDGR